MASEAQRIQRGAGSSPLLHQLVEAARAGDRKSFDRLFDRCFDQVYGIACHVMRDRGRAQAATARILCEAVIEAASARC
jgi:hypothetical protein